MTSSFPTKIAVLLRDDLAVWQRLNVTAFVVSGIAGTQPSLLGSDYSDADGTPYLPMFGQPVMIFEGAFETLRAAHARAVERGVACAVFTEELFKTGNDDDNRAAVRAVPRAELRLVGLAVHGPKNSVDRILKGARLHG
ncbi:DUF2000 family protein [Dactylosporangium sucinum]|uniref:DUF2000 domain-containing protein n=1 Tax=Dactylosporangium sucinum TaxID=1424081 RepID=A0A917T410_9ACTN|nr:DUF2000 domain-containing protein [Dactylosporangium sucinum]GGM08330.1 hypothetical protein GCM10007977_006700 [Dactylosporangium sucinum]